VAVQSPLGQTTSFAYGAGNQTLVTNPLMRFDEGRRTNVLRHRAIDPQASGTPQWRRPGQWR
jgi:hypothetical protein